MKKKSEKYDELKAIKNTFMCLLLGAVVLSIANIFICDKTIVGFIYGIDIAAVVTLFVISRVEEHNFKVKMKEYNEKMNMREDFDITKRLYKQKRLKGCEILTTDLGVNLQKDENAKPLYFITIVVSEEHKELNDIRREYSTKEEAIKGHKEIIKLIRAELKEKK